MRVRENPKAAHEMLVKARKYQDEQNGRAAGMHVSDLIHCSRMAYFRLHGIDEGPESDDFMTIVLAGQGHHSILEAGRKEKKGTINLNGEEVHGSVDIHEFLDELSGEIPAEVKTTRYSSKSSAPLQHPHYSEQLASYVLMDLEESASLDRFPNDQMHPGRLYALFIRGNYGSRSIDFKCYDCEWTTLELKEWRAELERRHGIERSETLPELNEHYDWECDYCSFKGTVCEGGRGLYRKDQMRHAFFKETARPPMSPLFNG